MADTTHELEILARVRDMVSPGMKAMATASRSAADELARTGSRGSTALDGVARSASRAAPGLRALGETGRRASQDLADGAARAGQALGGIDRGARSAAEELKRLAAESRRTADGMVADAERAAAAGGGGGGGVSLGGIGRAAGKGAKYGRIAGGIASATAMALGAGSGSGVVSSVASDAAYGASLGSAIPGVGSGIGAAAGAVFGLIRGLDSAKDRAGALAAEEAKAADATRSAAEERARATADFIRDTEREIALINARSDAERTSLKNAYELDDVRSKLGDAAAGEVRLRQEAVAQKALDESRVAGWKAKDEQWTKEAAQAAKERENAAKSAADRKAALDAEVDGMLARSRMSEDELRFAREHKLIGDEIAAGDTKRAALLREHVEAMKAQAVEAEKARTAAEARAVAEREIEQMNREQVASLRAQNDERKRAHEGAMKAWQGESTVTGPDDAPTSGEAPRRGRGGGGEAAAPESGGVVDLRKQAREAKRQRARDEHTRHRNANFLAERGGGGMGFTIDGNDDGSASWNSGGGDMDGRKHVRFKKETGRLGPRAPTLDDGSGSGSHLDQAFPGGGFAPQSGGRATASRATTFGGDGAPVDNRGATDGIKSLEDAMKRNEEAMKASAEMTSKTAEAASRSADTLKEISVVQTDIATKSEESASTLGELRDGMDKTATAMGEAAASAVDLRADVTKLQEQVQKLREAIGTSQDGG